MGGGGSKGSDRSVSTKKTKPKSAQPRVTRYRRRRKVDYIQGYSNCKKGGFEEEQKQEHGRNMQRSIIKTLVLLAERVENKSSAYKALKSIDIDQITW